MSVICSSGTPSKLDPTTLDAMIVTGTRVTDRTVLVQERVLAVEGHDLVPHLVQDQQHPVRADGRRHGRHPLRRLHADLHA